MKSLTRSKPSSTMRPRCSRTSALFAASVILTLVGVPASADVGIAATVKRDSLATPDDYVDEFISAGSSGMMTWSSSWQPPCVDAQGNKISEQVTWSTISWSPNQQDIAIDFSSPAFSNGAVQQHMQTTTLTPVGIYTFTSVESGTLCSGWGGLNRLTVRPALSANPDADLWWFGGEKPEHYDTDMVLQTAGTGPWTWTILNGFEAVEFPNHAASIITTKNTVKIKTKGVGTDPMGVQVKVTENGVDSFPLGFHVFAPASAVLESSGTISSDVYGYFTSLLYTVYDNTGQALTKPIEINENFTSETKADYPNENWERASPGGGINENFIGQFTDGISPPALVTNPYPIPVYHQNPGNSKVEHWSGEIYAGSVKPGKGIRLQTNNWVKYIDHGAHTNRVSPAPKN